MLPSHLGLKRPTICIKKAYQDLVDREFWLNVSSDAVILASVMYVILFGITIAVYWPPMNEKQRLILFFQLVAVAGCIMFPLMLRARAKRVRREREVMASRAYELVWFSGTGDSVPVRDLAPLVLAIASPGNEPLPQTSFEGTQDELLHAFRDAILFFPTDDYSIVARLPDGRTGMVQFRCTFKDPDTVTPAIPFRSQQVKAFLTWLCRIQEDWPSSRVKEYVLARQAMIDSPYFQIKALFVNEG